MINVNTEQLIDVDEAAQLARVTHKCIYGWMNRSERKLESIKWGGKRMTSREAMQRFAQQGDDPNASAPVLPGGGPKTDYASAMQAAQERHGSF